ncbi:hypothetical protein DP939_11925 [Spongiactinospora rosea]|uniref:HNH nuclease domain-containing protein n=1 Tax=Spongiactinospora rosea TaxID=2248750 RepID=A0A366M2Q6_9ACTN|nr:HNH endonuclease [Spongiactinospora rosea]RBQ20475.1 hypothetical protein DP939_11925 [Spongiactinospora rosea]
MTTRPNSDKRQRYRRQLAARDGARCFYCRHRFADPATEATLDHLVPTALGGTWARANLVLACEPCNQAKADRPPTAFVRTCGFRPGLRPRRADAFRRHLAALAGDRSAAARALLARCVRPVRKPSKPDSGDSRAGLPARAPDHRRGPFRPFRPLVPVLPALLVLAWTVVTHG